MGLLILFGLLASGAAWSTWRDEELRWVGILLVFSFVGSNVLHAAYPVTYMPGPYSVFEILILIAIAVAADIHAKLYGAYRILLALGAVNILSICCNIAFAIQIVPDRRHIFLFELTTNLCFAAECVLATIAGVADGYRTGRFVRVFGHRRRDLAADAAESNKVA